MKEILVTGGPVHAYLDAVKIVTNVFQGGLMCQLAESLAGFGANVTYLTSELPSTKVPASRSNIRVLTHKGFADYHRQVLELAPQMDAVVLGAAVANLIPVKPYAGKFPSHNFKPGDIIPIEFMVAPRIIDEVKTLAPNTLLFGFKLLSGVDRPELVSAAYDIVLNARAATVFANDAGNLQKIFAVTKERGIHEMSRPDLAGWIWDMLQDAHYRSVPGEAAEFPQSEADFVGELISQYKGRFTSVETGLIFGTVAVRCPKGFVTTGRGKRELDSLVYVTEVNHNDRTVHTVGGEKASLNAPLLAVLFENPRVTYILHFHQLVPGLPTEKYAPPGTVRDAKRPNTTSFNIEGHGCMLLMDEEGRQL